MRLTKTMTGLALCAALGFPAAGLAQSAPFGTEEDAAFAAMLWEVMKANRLAGEGAIRSFPYEGLEPHGLMLETFYTDAEVDGRRGALVVKRNYGPAGVEMDQIMANPEKHLGSVTVMFQREDGYDPDNQNWFWVKYLPDGSLDKNPKGMELAGRVAKGADQGCIACHSGAPGEDYLWTANAMPGMEMMKN